MRRQGGEPAPYDDFAWFYDLYWADAYARDVRPILGDLLLPHLEPGARIIDFCCGTGRLAAWLADLGFSVAGVDISSGMLALARESRSHAEWIECDARIYAAIAPADCAVALFDSVNHFATLDELRVLFANVARNLESGAPFFFDVNLESAFVSSDGDSSAYVEPDHACIAESDWRPAERAGSSRVAMFRLLDGAWQRFDAEIVEYAYARHEILSLLDETGFVRPQTWMAEEDLEMPEGTGRMFVFAEKE